MTTILNIIFRIFKVLILLMFVASCQDEVVIYNNGLNSLINIVELEGGDYCQNGGVRIETGLDLNDDNVLTENEINNINYLCNGKNGINGVDGKNMLSNFNYEIEGSNCPLGGYGFTYGVDKNDNNYLDLDEVLDVKYICNGENGLDGEDGKIMLTNFNYENSGENCEVGGYRLDYGLDLNNNYILDSNEIVRTEYICEEVKDLAYKILSTEGIVALWKFDEDSGQKRFATTSNRSLGYPLQEVYNEVKRVDEGPLSGYSIYLDGSNYLSLSNDLTKELNIYGADAEVTMVAWVKREKKTTGFIGGMWNEYSDGGKRQYGLFVSLPMYNGENNVCGHISNTGYPTPPFPYSIDYSASKQQVELEKWTCIAFTYDGQYIKSYVDGDFESREVELINNTIGYIGYPKGLLQNKNPYYFSEGIGNNGSDFTVGAVRLKKGMGNFYVGLIGGVAVFNRALDAFEIKKISN